MKWFSIKELFPKAGDKIIVKLIGCKLPGFKYMYKEVREGEGFGDFEFWRYIKSWEK